MGCSPDWAPWYAIPSNRNWVRDLLIARVVVDTLEKLDMKYPLPEPGLENVVIPA